MIEGRALPPAPPLQLRTVACRTLAGAEAPDTACAAASPRPLCGEPINIGTGTRTDLLSVLRHMAAALGCPADAEFLPARAGDIRDSVADISRARELLGYEVTIDFAEGIRRMFAAPAGNTSAPAPALR